MATATRCPGCGAETGPEYRFCIGCGAPVAAVAPGAAAPTATCAECSAPIDAGYGYCIKCGAAIPDAAHTPGVWRRVATFSIAWALIMGGVYPLVWAASYECEAGSWVCWDEQDLVVLALIFGTAPAWVAAALFFVATVAKFGRFRRALVATGAGMVAAGVTLWTPGLAMVGLGLGVAGALVVGGAVAYLAYRLAR